MSNVLARLEVIKLADELGVAEEGLDFLAETSTEDLRRLRRLITHARFARHQHRLSRLAGLTKIAPAGLAAKIAEHALGAEVSGRVATLIDPADAGKLTRHLSPEFLTDVSVALDPDGSEAVITSLSQSLVIDVGRRLLKRGEHLTLARFVAVYDVEVALAVLEDATGDDLLTTAMFAEDYDALDAIVAALSDDAIATVIEAAGASEREADAIAMLTFLSEHTRGRLLAAIRTRPQADQDRFFSLAAELGYAKLVSAS